MNSKRDLSKRLDPISERESNPTLTTFIPSSPIRKFGISTVKAGYIKSSPLQTSLDLTVSNPKNKLEPLLSPKDHAKQKLSLNINLAAADLKGKAETTRLPSPRSHAELSDFMAGLYKRPIESSEDNVKSFVSFRTIAYNNAKSPSSYKDEEAFLPPPQNEEWRSQLELNKKREVLFKQTLNDMFLQSNQQFFRMNKQKETQIKNMPHVKIYTTATNNFRGKSSMKKSFDQEVLQHKLYQKQEVVPDYSSRVRIAKDEPFKFYLFPTTDTSSSMRKPHSREGATMNSIGKNIYLYGGVARETYNEWDVLDTSKT